MSYWISQLYRISFLNGAQLNSVLTDLYSLNFLNFPRISEMPGFICKLFNTLKTIENFTVTRGNIEKLEKLEKMFFEKLPGFKFSVFSFRSCEFSSIFHANLKF